MRDGPYGEIDHRAVARQLFKLDEQCTDDEADDILIDVFSKPPQELEKVWPSERGRSEKILDFAERFYFHALRSSFFWTKNGLL